jgi:hypothetical protein
VELTHPHPLENYGIGACGARSLDAIVGGVLGEEELFDQVTEQGGVALSPKELPGIDFGDVREQIGLDVTVLSDEMLEGLQQLTIAEAAKAR